MAIFGLKKNTVKKEVATKATVVKPAKKEAKKTVEKAIVERVNSGVSLKPDIIIRPRITEKSGLANESQNIYTFEVSKNATKGSVAEAIKDMYKVTPLKIRTISLPAKVVVVRGRYGTQSAIKKALVYLKKGDKIEIA